ncbi:MAG: hypothetical protein ABII07_00950 [Patescibacteria group bacterium]|nr:hypothetical protein [Patescibacteria group bacterium]
MNLIKKLISITATAIILSSLSTGAITFAQGVLTDVAGAGMEAGNAAPAAATQNTAALESFSVTDYLTIPGEQEQVYLNDENNSPIIAFLLMIINFLSQIIGTVAIGLIIIGGLFLLASEGDDSRVQKGKTIIVQAIIGLIIALASYIIVTLVQSLLYVQS